VTSWRRRFKKGKKLIKKIKRGQERESKEKSFLPWQDSLQKRRHSIVTMTCQAIGQKEKGIHGCKDIKRVVGRNNEKNGNDP